MRIPTLGDVCISLKGHDMGRTYIVFKILDAEFVAVCDGKYHKKEKPKKKRVKHIHLTGARVHQELLNQMLRGSVTDNEIHREILQQEGKCKGMIE